MINLETNGNLSVDLNTNDNLSVDLNSESTMSLNLTVPRIVGGTGNYEKLKNKPQIESVELIGNKTFPELGISSIDADDLIEILQ